MATDLPSLSAGAVVDIQAAWIVAPPEIDLTNINPDVSLREALGERVPSGAGWRYRHDTAVGAAEFLAEYFESCEKALGLFSPGFRQVGDASLKNVDHIIIDGSVVLCSNIIDNPTDDVAKTIRRSRGDMAYGIIYSDKIEEEGFIFMSDIMASDCFAFCLGKMGSCAPSSPLLDILGIN